MSVDSHFEGSEGGLAWANQVIKVETGLDLRARVIGKAGKVAAESPKVEFNDSGEAALGIFEKEYMQVI